MTTQITAPKPATLVLGDRRETFLPKLIGILTVTVTARERDVVLTGLRFLQTALETGPVAPMLRNILTESAAYSGAGPHEIDALCERIKG